MGRATRQKDAQQPVTAKEDKMPRMEDDGGGNTLRPDPSDVSTKLDAILATLVKLDSKVDTVASDLNLLRADQKK